MELKTLILTILLIFTTSSQALTEPEAEELADLTAVFVFLKNDCGYYNLPAAEVRRALLIFAQQNRWDLTNYASFDMKVLGEASYRDLSGIPIAKDNKCKSLARESLGVLASVR